MIFTADDWNVFERSHENYLKIHGEMSKAILGVREVVDEILIALFCDSHVLLSGQPGLASGLLLWTLSKALGLTFSRIQFTSDLLPEDLTGSEIVKEDIATGRPISQFFRGPIFSQMIKADELNLAPPETQAVLFQAMQHRTVHVGERMLRLGKPFLVVASHFPWQNEDRYPVADERLNLFILDSCWELRKFDEASLAAEYDLIMAKNPIDAVLNSVEIDRIQKLVRRLPIAEPVVDHVVHRSALGTKQALVSHDRHIIDALTLAAKAHAVLYGQPQVSIDDVDAVAPSVLRHRIHRKG